MIDIESAVFNAVAEELRAVYPDIYVTGDISASPSRFPAVFIVETSNSVLTSMRTANIENAVTVMYEVNVYSNKIGYGKSEAKDILATADAMFSRIGFTRIFSNQVQNLEDKQIYRIVARYEAVVDKDLWIYQT